MNEEAAFLRAICEHPDEDTPRLAFADWLTEQGGPVNLAWAGGIRAQVWLARGATDDALRFQACVFDSRFGQEKLRERLAVPPELVCNWERGFPSEAGGPFRELRRVWPGLAFRVPIRRLSVYHGSEANVEKFARWPALHVLRELNYSGAWRTPAPPHDLLPALAGCSGLRGLKSLTVRVALFNEDNVTRLLDSPHLAGLTRCRLDLDRNTTALSDDLKDRLEARFGEEVFEEAIPF